MPLRFRPGTPEEPCISGMNSASMVRSIRELYGDPTYTRALEVLRPDQREELEGLHAMGWIRSATLDDLVGALSTMLHRSSDFIYDEVMRHGGERWFRLAWRVLLGFLSDHVLVSRAGVIFAKTRNCGQMVGGLTSPGRADLRLSDWPDVPARSVRNFALAIESILAAAGRPHPRVRWERTADGAHLVVTWRVDG